jgi:hypothetical protein
LSALARKHNMSLRELRDFAAAAMGHRLLCGTPEGIADGLEEWFVAGAADGFNLMPPWFPGAFDDFVDYVVPILQRRGLFRTEYTGRTLRDHLGLPRPPRLDRKASGEPADMAQPLATDRPDSAGTVMAVISCTESSPCARGPKVDKPPS